ncbi:MAG TPA: alpha/beta fold hydrolase [Polyangiaceae bacterium]|nr:alpha/beta fold hydrolase [Polyangiaceae bacterium]
MAETFAGAGTPWSWPIPLAPTPRDAVATFGNSTLVRFRSAEKPTEPRLPLLLVPSMINRWYVLDLRPGASLAAALAARGLDVFCLDWGVPQDEDRHLSWDEVVRRLEHAMHRVLRVTGQERLGVLGYCMGGTLSAIAAARNQDRVAALANLAGPVDFAKGGLLTELVAPQHFDAEAVASAGNVSPMQMQSGFWALRPTGQLAKWFGLADRGDDPAFRDAFEALETWAGDNIPFPAAAYTTYIRELYQENRLVRGEHAVMGERVDLANIRCPLLSIVADRDTICPPAAALALAEKVSSKDKQVVTASGGHVGAVVGSKAQKTLYPPIADWFWSKLCNSTN